MCCNPECSLRDGQRTPPQLSDCKPLWTRPEQAGEMEFVLKSDSGCLCADGRDPLLCVFCFSTSYSGFSENSYLGGGSAGIPWGVVMATVGTIPRNE